MDRQLTSVIFIQLPLSGKMVMSLPSSRVAGRRGVGPSMAAPLIAAMTPATGAGGLKVSLSQLHLQWQALFLVYNWDDMHWSLD